MGGKSSSSNSTRSDAYDNRVINQNEIDNSVRNDIDARQDIDNSVRNDIDARQDIDNSVSNVTDARQDIDNSVRNDLGEGSIFATGNVSVNTLDGGAIEDAFDFAENIAGKSIAANSAALSSAFNSTAGGVITAGKDLLKYGGLGLAVLMIFMILNKDK